MIKLNFREIEVPTYVRCEHIEYLTEQYWINWILDRHSFC